MSNFDEITNSVHKWWGNLQLERKCTSTNTIQKVVNDSPPEIQQHVRQLISEEIKKLIDKCCQSKELKDLQCTCNAINGCFDNFMHAADAVRVLFPEIISFIDFGFDKCQAKLNLRSNQKNSVLELLHSFSRILILVLKLKRTQNVGKTKTNQIIEMTMEEMQKVTRLLSRLTYKIAQLLLMEDILIDTKNNLSISAILIREILIPEEEKLVQFHRNFIDSIPVSLSDGYSKLNILKFLTCSAIINTWSVNIIDIKSTYTYLKFFISLCEKYSSETPIVLNTSRTLLLLIKHESFKKFVNDSEKDNVDQMTSSLLSCVFMLLEHPVACVRNSAKDFLQLLATHPSLHNVMINSVFQLPTDKRSYFISVGALANEIGTEILMKSNPELPTQLIGSLCDPTIVSHVALALEFVILKDSLAVKNFSKWCETYIVPLLVSLMTVLPIVAAEIEKLLEKAFKKYPNSVIYVIERWANPTSAEELRFVVTALKISQKHGFKFKNSSINNLSSKNIENNENKKENEKDLISERLLEHCLHQRDDDIRISTFSLLVEAHKSTKPYTEKDFKLILHFFKYNLNNQQPATRQKILGLVRKMLVRFSESKATFLKPTKNQIDQEERARDLLLYDQFMDSLVEFCFNNIFVGCNFNRLNTVLNTLVLCFENVKDMYFNSDNTNYYWNKFLIALDSSYEENKELVVRLIQKLDLLLLDANKTKTAKMLYDKAFNLCTHMEPPDVLTGSYLLQALIKLPSSREVLTNYFVNEYAFDDVHFHCIQILMQKLKEQILLAKLDLMTAATCGPMYGALFAIRLIFKNMDFSDRLQRESALREWGKILNELVELCFEMTRIVGVVVNSSSPEGHLPMDFQTNFESLLSDFNGKCDLKDSNEETISRLSSNKTCQLIEIICDNFFQKLNKLEKSIESPDIDTYESLRSLSSLLKENQLLIRKIRSLNEDKNDEENKLLDLLSDAETKLNVHLKKFLRIKSIIEWPATAQVLLLCAWRSIKEASLYLGDLFTKLPIETEIELGLLTKNTIVRVGEELKTLLCEIKHRGAFEHAYIGFIQLANCLWKCSDKTLNSLPKQWLEDIKYQLESPLSDQKVKLCSTRRSAGLPFLVQAIICSEVVSLKSTTPSSLHTTMKSLLKIIETGVSQNSDAKIHALNILRALFKHAQLGEHVASYVAKALIAAIRGSRAASWSERNSSSLLFSSLIIRIFGVSRSQDEISKKNRMTSRYSELYDFLLSEMELVYSKENCTDGLYPKPSLYLVLLILGRLYPPPTEDPENTNLSEFLPYINMSCQNPIMKIRELGARALVPLISLDRLLDELDERFFLLSEKKEIHENERHGILLQIKELISQSQEALQNLSKERPEKKEIKWVKNTKWILEQPNRQISLITLSAYIKVLHLLYKNLPSTRGAIGELVENTTVADHLLKLNPPEQRLAPGIFLFLMNFYFLKTDIVVFRWLYSNDSQGSCKFIDLFMFMLGCEISEVQSVPLRILCHVLSESTEMAVDFDDDDFTGLGGGVPIADLFLFRSKEKVKYLEKEILNSRDILKFLINRLNEEECSFKSRAIHRIWLMVVSTLVMNDVISLSHSTSSNFLKIDFAKSLIKSGDKDLSTSALICYSIYLFDEICFGEESTVDGCLLAEILNEFSISESDVKKRMAIAKIINRCCKKFLEKTDYFASDPVLLQIWMIPLKLIVDEDPGVRLLSGELTHKLQEHITREVPPEKRIINMKTLDWPYLSLVSLKAQECLLDCYINILGSDNLFYFVVQLLVLALSSLWELDDPESYSKDEFGVFEKGNPNPYCEDLAFSDLICRKLTELSFLTDFNSFMWTDLNSSFIKFISDNLNLPNFQPHSLMEVVESVTTFVETTENLRGEFSVPRLQVKNLRKALGLSEVV